MPDISAWRDAGQTWTQRWATDAWQRIQEKPSAIAIYRDKTRTTPEQTLDPQTVRLEFSNTVREVGGEGGRTSVRDLIVFGVNGHETVVDTDIKRNDVFEYDGVRYRVMDIVITTGEVQARAEALS